VHRPSLVLKKHLTVSEYASKIKRAIATLVDLVLYFIFAVAVYWIAHITGMIDFSLDLQLNELSSAHLLINAFNYITYMIPAMLILQATPGQYAMDICYVDKTGAAPHVHQLIGQALGRFCVNIFIPFLIIIDYLIVLFTRDRQTGSNLVFGLIVVNRSDVISVVAPTYINE
jgi:uncharacterized RDD family membrane protein YckC